MAYFPRIPAKSTDPHDPQTFYPRGHMFNVFTEQYFGTNFDFLNNYQKRESDGGLGAINLCNNSRDTAKSGILIAPPVGTVFYIPSFSIIVEELNHADANKNLDDLGGGHSLQMIHSGMPYCSIFHLAGLFTAGALTHRQTHGMFTAGTHTHIITIPSTPAGRFSGDGGEYFQIRMSDDLPPVNSHMMTMHFSFLMWKTTEAEES